MRLIIVTGMSGSGKSVAIRQLEDSGYYCIDNLPIAFLEPVAASLVASQPKVAFSIDARNHVAEHFDSEQLIDQLKQQGWDVKIIFLTASTTELVQRFSETRRRHPLSLRSNQSEIQVTLSEAIEKEREILEPFLSLGHIIDTTNLQSNTLRNWINDFVQSPQSSLTLTFESFGYKHGIPLAADLVFDVRNLPNPYYDKSLRDLTGLDKPVQTFMQAQESAKTMIADIAQFIDKWLPSYQATNRHYLTIGIGCTGGQHRSVYVAQSLGQYFAKKYPGVIVRHRIIEQRSHTKLNPVQTL